MQRVRSAIKIQGFQYDFAIDTGAVATYTTPILIPAGAIIVGAVITRPTAVTGAASNLSIGWLGTLAGFGGPSASAGAANTVIITVGLLGNVSNGLPVLFTILNNPITAGRIRGQFIYMESF
jgi:hypothetical protein